MGAPRNTDTERHGDRAILLHFAILLLPTTSHRLSASAGVLRIPLAESRYYIAIVVRVIAQDLAATLIEIVLFVPQNLSKAAQKSVWTIIFGSGVIQTEMIIISAQNRELIRSIILNANHSFPHA
jgi:tellurite resistance protein TehA-like permease